MGCNCTKTAGIRRIIKTIKDAWKESKPSSTGVPSNVNIPIQSQEVETLTFNLDNLEINKK